MSGSFQLQPGGNEAKRKLQARLARKEMETPLIKRSVLQ